MSNFANRKPHAVLVPFPAQGHINPMFKLAKLLHLRGFHITFHKRLLKSRGPNSLDGFDGFNFETIPDGLTPLEGNGDVSQDLAALTQSIRKNFLHPFGELLSKLHDSTTAGLTPPVTCIVSDCFIPFTIQAAEEIALPILLFSPGSSFVLSTMKVVFGYQDVMDQVTNGVEPITATSTDAEKAVHKEAKKKDFKALFIISYIKVSVLTSFEKLSDSQSSKEACDTLATAYASVEKVNKVEKDKQFDHFV